jgi:hypothetical protein
MRISPAEFFGEISRVPAATACERIEEIEHVAVICGSYVLGERGWEWFCGSIGIKE